MFWYFPKIVLFKSWWINNTNISAATALVFNVSVCGVQINDCEKICNVSYRHLHHILLHKYDSDSHLLLCTFWCEHQVHFKRLWSPLVVHVDQTIIVSVVIHHDIPHQATAILFNLGPNSTKYSDVAWKEENMQLWNKWLKSQSC